MHPKLFLPVLVSGLLFCSQVFSQRIFKESLPPDFNCTGCVLIILKKEPFDDKGPEKKLHTRLNEMIEKKLIENYDSKTVFTTAVDFDTNKVYRDTAIYRFILGIDVYKVEGSMPTTIRKVNGQKKQQYMSYEQGALNCHLYDRSTKKGYPQITNHPAWPKHLEAVAEALNKLLKK